MTTTQPDAALFPRTLRPLAEAAAAGAIALPKAVTSAISRVRDLAVAAREAEHDAAEARTANREASTAAIRRLAEHGPTSDPSAPVRAAAELSKARDLDSELYREAVRRAESKVAQAFLDASPDLAAQLTAGLRDVLETARDSGDAALLAGARVPWADPDAIHELPAELAAAFHRLVPLARRHDAIRASANSLAADLHLAGRPDTTVRRRLLADLDAAASVRPARQSADEEWLAGFALAGYLTGPAPRFAGSGDPRHATRWAIVDRGEHPVARLVRAALSPADPLDVDGPDEPTIRPGSRTPIRSGVPLGR